MNDYEHLMVEQEDGVAILTLNRPEVLNAINNKLASEIGDAVNQIADDGEIGCIVITGAGERAFSAGGDIHEQRENDNKYNQQQLDEMADMRSRYQYDVFTSPKPTIGMMNGLAFGGAAVLASALDMRVGCERTAFRFLAAAYGRINSTWTLSNQVGWPIAKELLFTARKVEADEAFRIGLLNHVVPAQQLRTKTMELAKQIAANNSEAVVGIKKLLLEYMGQDSKQQWNGEKHYTKNVARGAKAEDAFPEFIARRGRAV
mgnify:CR=1 FL=1|jgi:enoyl-CoA hydratase/carnithine racemase